MITKEAILFTFVTKEAILFTLGLYLGSQIPKGHVLRVLVTVLAVVSAIIVVVDP